MLAIESLILKTIFFLNDQIFLILDVIFEVKDLKIRIYLFNDFLHFFVFAVQFVLRIFRKINVMRCRWIKNQKFAEN